MDSLLIYQLKATGWEGELLPHLRSQNRLPSSHFSQRRPRLLFIPQAGMKGCQLASVQCGQPTAKIPGPPKRRLRPIPKRHRRTLAPKLRRGGRCAPRRSPRRGGPRSLPGPDGDGATETGPVGSKKETNLKLETAGDLRKGCNPNKPFEAV